MRIALIGTIVKDLIYHSDGSESASLGGLLYTINALGAVAGERDAIIPLSYVGSDIAGEVFSYLGRDRRIDLSGLIRRDQPNNAVQLHYGNAGERMEKSRHPLPPLDYDALQPALDADLVLVNMISGWDVGFEAFREFKRNYRGIIGLDVHSLALGRKSDGTRFYNKIDRVDSWIEGCNIVQYNEWEFEIIRTSLGLDKKNFYESCIDEGKIFNLTRSFRGSYTFTREEGQIRRIAKAVPAHYEVIDPTGCGDAFIAGFAVPYLKNGNIVLAAEQANHLAALVGTFKGLAEASDIKEAIWRSEKERNQ